MKLYLFYRKVPGLEPYLYGYTTDKLHAEMFHLYRPQLCEIVKDVKKEEYVDMVDKIPGKRIIPHEFKTSRNRFGKDKVLQIATEDEVMNIILHKEELVLRELSKYAFPTDLFTGEMKEALENLHMDTVYKWNEEVAIYPWDTKMKPDFGFEIDELGLFVQLYGHTIGEPPKEE